MSLQAPQTGTASPDHNVGGWIEAHAQHQGEAVALRFEGVSTSYREMANRVEHISQQLLLQGVRRGDRVAILLENQPAWLETFFACIRIGALALPLNGRLTATELDFILRDATPVLVVSERPYPDPLRAARAAQPRETRPALLSIDDLGRFLETAPRTETVPLVPTDPMMLMYTSGTTGHPKGAVLSHRKALFNCLNAQLAFELETHDRGLVTAPLFHSLGIQILALPILHAGASLVLQRRFDAESALDCIQDEGVTFMGGVPTCYERIADHLATRAPGGIDPGSLRFLFTAGAAISAPLVRRYADWGLDLRQGYGQTETSLLCCLDAENALRKAGSVGRPVAHCELRIIDPESLEHPTGNWRDAASDEIGEIVVRGPIIMTRYWNAAQATAETLRDGWLLTGDLARMDPEGFVYLEGRSREMFISGGENVYPVEIEATYVLHPEIQEIAVVARPDSEWGEVGAAFVVCRSDWDCDPVALRAWGKERLANFKIPRRFHRIDSLPRTASGKVRKHLLRE